MPVRTARRAVALRFTRLTAAPSIVLAGPYGDYGDYIRILQIHHNGGTQDPVLFPRSTGVELTN